MGAETAVEKYSEDALPAYTPMPWYEKPLPSFSFLVHTLIILTFRASRNRSLKEIRAAIPPEFFIRDTRLGLAYLARDILMAAAAWSLATFIDPFFKQSVMRESLTPVGAEIGRWAAWGV